LKGGYCCWFLDFKKSTVPLLYERIRRHTSEGFEIVKAPLPLARMHEKTMLLIIGMVKSLITIDNQVITL